MVSLAATPGKPCFSAFSLYLVLEHAFGPMGGHYRRPAQSASLALKKSRKTRIFVFDLRKSPPYNPRPRCFAANGFEVVFTVDFRRENRRRALFDIVISGRGTWAAARYATMSKVKL